MKLNFKKCMPVPVEQLDHEFEVLHVLEGARLVQQGLQGLFVNGVQIIGQFRLLGQHYEMG